MLWKRSFKKKVGFEVYTPQVDLEKVKILDYMDIKVYHFPLSDDWHVGNLKITNKYGTYKSLGMAKKIARGVIEGSLNLKVTRGIYNG